MVIKSKNKLIPFKLSRLSLGLGVAGNVISNINNSIGSNVSQAGISSSKFIAPSVNITMGSFLINKLKNLKR